MQLPRGTSTEFTFPSGQIVTVPPLTVGGYRRLIELEATMSGAARMEILTEQAKVIVPAESHALIDELANEGLEALILCTISAWHGADPAAALALAQAQKKMGHLAAPENSDPPLTV